MTFFIFYVIIYKNYKKEKEQFKREIEQYKQENAKLTDQNLKLKMRKNVLEKELKSQKEELVSKIKILIEKSDNDEKLIIAMKNELLKKGNNIGTIFFFATQFQISAAKNVQLKYKSQ